MELKTPILDESNENYPDLNTHHPAKTFGYIKFVGMLTGCGLGQIHGITSYYELNTFKKDLEPVIKYCRDNGCGTILCTLGSGYFEGNTEKILLQYGFKIIYEYRNLKHIQLGAPKHRQRLYSFDII